MRNGNYSPSSNDDNASSMDYENINSPQLESGRNSTTSDSTAHLNKSETTTEEYSSLGSMEINLTKDKSVELDDEIMFEDDVNKSKIKITDTIPIFDADGETNDNWYASASEQEDDEHRGVYRNNPVLECMNQILLQNINDPTVTPPKTPNVEKKFNKNKKVKFSDEEDNKSVQNENNKSNELESNYYETPVQRVPNVYETPQSIYSNDYEQILSQCSETFQNNVEENIMKSNNVSSPKRPNSYLNNDSNVSELSSSHYYIAMDTKSEQDESENKIIRKSKILRTPPALPPKPANLLSKYKIQNLHFGFSKDQLSERSLESEPDYCSISEINLPTIKNGHKSTVVAEINLANVEPLIKKSMKSVPTEEISQSSKTISDVPLSPQYKPVSLSQSFFNLKVNKNVDKINAQSPGKTENVTNKKVPSPEIPKLPQVTEIIIPEENDSKSDMCVNHDNYVKNNTQILQQKGNRANRTRSIQIGSSVSSLIASFNNKQILSEINQTPNDRRKKNGTMFSSFENLQNLETHLSLDQKPKNHFESFDLSQNFEEFKLDDCEIDDYAVNCTDTVNEIEIKKPDVSNNKLNGKILSGTVNYNSPTRVELVRATNDVINTPTLNMNALQHFKKKLELEKNRVSLNHQVKTNPTNNSKYSEPTYEHFLECTGLSSKSILTPSRLVSNHKSVLKPKDVKLRSKAKANALEKEEVAVKYWSEQFL
ncbi:hypothetical protein FQR65_LT10425 [Abscondita terminalis]|nr:hypothetical protein FQR65_LT10425 [Abscondita terminalis]